MKKKTIGILNLVLILIPILLLVGCSDDDLVVDESGVMLENTKLEQLKPPKPGDKIAIFKTNKGDIKVKLLDEEKVSKTIENFVTHAENGYYDGVSFHRVIDDFMIQSGDPDGTGMGGESIWGKTFEDEFHPEYKNYRGALSMANAGPDTNGSQFFIVQAKEVPEELIEQMEELGDSAGFSEESIKAYKVLGGTPTLDGRHTVFGQVYEGMDIVDNIARVKTDDQDKPVEDIIIESIEISEF